MKSMIDLFLITLAVCGLHNPNMQPAQMDTGTIVPSAIDKCHD